MLTKYWWICSNINNIQTFIIIIAYFNVFYIVLMDMLQVETNIIAKMFG